MFKLPLDYGLREVFYKVYKYAEVEIGFDGVCSFHTVLTFKKHYLFSNI